MLLGLLVAPAARAQDSRLEKSGTVGLFGGAQYATVTGDNRYGNDFDSGFGFNLGLRYVLGRHFSLGVDFQNQSYDAKNTARPVEVGVDNLVITGIGGELLYYRNRNSNASQYLVFGVGFYRPEIRVSDSEVIFPEESLALSAGLGVEIFIRENWGLDLSGRAIGYFGDGVAAIEEGEIPSEGSFALGLQARAGLMFYLIK